MKPKNILIFIIFFISEIYASGSCSQMVSLSIASAGLYITMITTLCIADKCCFKKKSNNDTDAEKAQLLAHNASQFKKYFKSRACIACIGISSVPAMVVFGLLALINCYS